MRKNDSGRQVTPDGKIPEGRTSPAPGTENVLVLTYLVNPQARESPHKFSPSVFSGKPLEV